MLRTKRTLVPHHLSSSTGGAATTVATYRGWLLKEKVTLKTERVTFINA